MKLVFIYQPVRDLQAAVQFYSGELGLREAWREGSGTVAFATTDDGPQLMLSSTDQPPGPMYLVDDLEQWVRAHSTVTVLIPAYDIPGGSVAGFTGPGGHTFYVFDQRGSRAAPIR